MKTLNRFYGYIKKDLVLFYKRKKYLYLFLGIPLILALLFVFALNPSNYSLSAGVCDEDSSELSEEVFKSMKDFRFDFIDSENCEQELINGIISGRYDIGFRIPYGFYDNINNLKQSRVIVYYDNTDLALSNLISWRIDVALTSFRREIIDSLNQELSSRTSSVRSNMDIVFELVSFSPALERRVTEIDEDLKNIEEMETEFLVNPVWVDSRPIHEGVFDRSSGMVYVFPIIALFTILMLASISFIYDKKNGFITRVKSSSSGLSYLIAKLVFFILLVSIQFLIVYILFFINGGRYAFSLQNILLLILSVALINSLLGFLIGMFSENEGIAVLFSLIIAFPLMLVSGIFFPVQTLPNILQYFSIITPLNYQITASKAVLLFGESFSNLWIYGAIILFAVCFWLLKKER